MATAARCEAACRQRLTGTSLEKALAAVLAAAGIEPRGVGHVNAHGMSTVDTDRVEASAIKAVLGDTPVTAPKSLFGHLGAGGGAVELVASILGLEQGLVPATLNYETPDPACPINVVHGAPLAGRPASAISVNLCSTGQAAAVLIANA